MQFEYKNSRGKTYFLHQKGKLYYFSSSREGHPSEMPFGYKILENNKTGLPMLKKK